MLKVKPGTNDTSIEMSFYPDDEANINTQKLCRIVY